MLTPLTHLTSLALKLGGTRDLGLSSELVGLEHLELWMVKGLADLTAVGMLPELEQLFLQALRQVDTLPEMTGLTGLRRLWLETMKGLTDLSPVRGAPGLRDLAVVDMGHLQPEAFAPLVGHPTLASLRPGLGSRRKNEGVTRIVDLPADSSWRKPAGV